MGDLVFHGIMTRDPVEIRWIGLAGNRAVPDDVLLTLAGSDLPEVLQALSERRSLSQAIVELLIDYWRRTGDVSPLPTPAARGRLPADMVRELATAPNPGARAVAAHAPALPVDLIAALARDAVTEVREFVSNRQDLPQSVVDVLLQDPEPYVRLHVVERAAPRWLPVLARDPMPQIRAYVGTHPATSAELRDELARDEDEWVRREVAKFNSPQPRPSTNYPRQPPWPLSEEEQAAAPAADPDTPPGGVLTELALGDHPVLVLFKACRNPALPVGVMRQIAEPLRR